MVKLKGQIVLPNVGQGVVAQDLELLEDGVSLTPHASGPMGFSNERTGPSAFLFF